MSQIPKDIKSKYNHDNKFLWVDDRIRYYEQEERLLTKDEMTIANEMWIKYGKKA